MEIKGGDRRRRADGKGMKTCDGFLPLHVEMCMERVR